MYNNIKKIRYFEGVAAGLIDAPIIDVTPNFSLFNGDHDAIKYAECHYRLKGAFDRHYWASIPYALEQECRLGSAILRLALKRQKKLTIWCMNMAEATLARSLSELSKGKVLSFANTTNIVNEHSFYAYGTPSSAYLKIIPDELVTAKFPDSVPNEFIDGFDIIIEDTSFQMKSPDRLTQICEVKKILKKNGILIMTEKLLGNDYLYWEKKKDICFKEKFFSKSSIENKQNHVLKKMIDNQVSLEDIRYTASKLFSCGSVFWNSGNFYSIAVCNDQDTLLNFIKALIPPCIPPEFSRGKELQTLFGIDQNQLSYRI